MGFSGSTNHSRTRRGPQRHNVPASLPACRSVACSYRRHGLPLAIQAAPFLSLVFGWCVPFIRSRHRDCRRRSATMRSVLPRDLFWNRNHCAYRMVIRIVRCTIRTSRTPAKGALTHTLGLSVVNHKWRQVDIRCWMTHLNLNR
jgi:hypothetical protein